MKNKKMAKCIELKRQTKGWNVYVIFTNIPDENYAFGTTKSMLNWIVKKLSKVK